jgi:hypothetical protein
MVMKMEMGIANVVIGKSCKIIAIETYPMKTRKILEKLRNSS